LKIRIVIVDDHEVVRIGMRSLLEQYSQYEVVGEAGNAKEAVAQVETYNPDIVLMDIRLPGNPASKPAKKSNACIPTRKY